MNGARLTFGVGSVHRIPLRSARQRLLKGALQAGFSSFDVAPAYGNGLNELELGIALGSERKNVRITTKFGVPFDPYGERHPSLFALFRLVSKIRGTPSEYSRRDFSVLALSASVDESLRRLRTDYVDRLMIHEPLEPLDAAALHGLGEAAHRLRVAGKIREFGIAGPTASFFGAAVHPAIDVVQAPLTDVLEFHAGINKPVVAFGVYRHFLSANVATSFADFVRSLLKRMDGLGLILSSTSPQTVGSFGALNV